MDSANIAPELEKLKSEPSLHLDSPLLDKTYDLVRQIFTPLRAVLIPRVPRVLLNPVSAEYFERTRKKAFGMSLAEVEQSQGAKDAWANAEDGLKELGDLLRQSGDGPFVMGQTPSYADLVIVSMFRFVERLGGDDFEKLMSFDRGFGTLYQACEKWLERDD